MTKQVKKQEANIVEFKLPSGIKVDLDKNLNTGNTLYQARKMATDPEETTLYILALICKFDGEKLAAPELKNYDAFDIMALEAAWADLRKKSQPQQ